MLAIDVAAEWWTYQLSNVSPQDNGESTHNALMSMVPQRTYDESQLNSFRDILIGNIMISPTWVRDQRLTIRNDYGPDKILYDTAELCGIKVGMFDLPIKTVMFIGSEYVRVGLGYRAPIVTIYETTKGASERMKAAIKDAEYNATDM